MQSFVRHVTPVTHEIQFSDVANKKDIAGMMDKLKLDVVEARILTGTEDLEKAAIIVESWGCPEIMITHSQGVLARVNGSDVLREVLQQQHRGQDGPRGHDLRSVPVLAVGS